MTACPIRYQRQVSDRKGKIFYTSITSLSHISKFTGLVMPLFFPSLILSDGIYHDMNMYILTTIVAIRMHRNLSKSPIRFAIAA